MISLFFFVVLMGILKALLTSSHPIRVLRNVNCLCVYLVRPIFLKSKQLTAKSGLDMEHLQSNPYFNKYAEKLKQIQELVQFSLTFYATEMMV